jgi:hypothetical protein
MFIQTESTPNPNTLKFLPGREVMGEGQVADFPVAETAGRSSLAAALFAVPEVSRVFFGSDFISVTKRDGDWKHLKPAILGAIMEHFTRGLPLISGSADEEEVARRIREAGERAAAEAEARRAAAKTDAKPREINGPKGPEPTRYGDWEKKGITSDF